LKALPGSDQRKPEPEAIHYGTHFTNMFVRSYGERVTTQMIEKTGKLVVLEDLCKQAMAAQAA
jgi:isopenicillin N synthase-like dioxygenase